ncbi:uncharacterized protein A4U43_C03F5090 [Asparagus officinalis]|uniref:Uncharacterized protein n=1 Tax=Asparagus officinalis TaxID=4686 RepID=A0A5P1F7H2_ASPOF|nr:uncharacterized protein A4U43_C03F5090 [Asparagus officinalis]
MEIEDQWGGRDSRQNSHDLALSKDFFKGNYESIEKLRKSAPVVNAVSQCKRATQLRKADENVLFVVQVINDEDDSSDEEASDMMLDERQSYLSRGQKFKTRLDHPIEEVCGWT